MLTDDRDDIEIQRCIDGELSPADMRRLLSRMDSIHDGWKQLACGMLEDRALTRIFSEGLPELPAADDSAGTADGAAAVRGEVRPVSSRLQRWWSHPVTSLTLCAAIAFVAGLLIPGSYSFPSSASSPDPRPGTAGDPATMAAGHAAVPPAATAASNEPPYRVRVMPDGADGGIEVPAYRADSPEYQQQLVRTMQQMRQLQLENSAPQRPVRLRIVRLPAGDEHDVLFLVDEYELGQPAQ